MSRRIPKDRYQQRRGEILRSAVAEINSRGVRGTTLGSVAGRLNMAGPAVSYYFKSKDDLAAAAFLQAIDHHRGLMQTAEARSPDARIAAFLEAFFEALRQIAVGERDALVSFNDVRALNNTAVNTAYVDMFRQARSLLPHAATMAAPERNAAAHLLISELLWVAAWIKWYEPHDYAAAAARMVSILGQGLARQARQSSRFAPLPLFAADADEPPSSSELFLRAATQLINAEGYHGASVARIAASLSLTKGSFYHHVETKDELVVACFERTFSIIWRAIAAADAEGGSGLRRIGSIIGALVSHQFRGDSPLLSSSALSTVPETVGDGLLEKLDRITRRYAMIISDGIADGSIRPVDVNIAACLITGAVNGAAELPFWAGASPRTRRSAFMSAF